MSILILSRICITLFSLFGYVYFFSNKLKPEFSIGVTLSIIGSVTFILGIFDKLVVSVILLVIGGFVCLIFALLRRYPVKNIFSFGTVFFGIMCLIILTVMHNSIFTHYDNFSHWAVAAKTIINFDRFPVAEDQFISFDSYPTAGASFIYFFCKTCGITSEWFQAYVQTILILSMFIPLFAFCKNKGNNIFCCIAIILLICSNTDFADLLVDTLLSALGFGAIALCIYYKDQLDKKLFYTVPYLIFLMGVKNSGVFFVIIVLLYCLIFIDKNRFNFAKLILVSASPVLSLLLWQRRVRLLFDNGLTARHSMSIEYFKDVFSEKSLEGIRETFNSMCKATFTFNNPAVYALLLIIMVLLLKKAGILNIENIFTHTVAIAVVSYFLYQAGTFGMYVFAMPGDEAAIGLAGYERYHPTIVTFSAAILCIGILYVQIKNIRSLYSSALLTIVSASVMFGTLAPHLEYYIPQKYRDLSYRGEINKLIAENNVQPHMRYMIIHEKDYIIGGYYLYMCNYLLEPSKCYEYTIDGLISDEGRLTRYDYLFIFDHSEETTAYLNSLLGNDLPDAIYLPDYVSQ